MMGFGFSPYRGTWAGLLPQLTGGLLILAFVGAANRRGNSRAWWLGFSLFGSAYLTWAWTSQLPDNGLLNLLWSPFGSLLRRKGSKSLDPVMYWQLTHSLLSLISAIVGGLLARLFFGDPRDGSTPHPDRQSTAEAQYSPRLTATVIALAGFYAFTLMVVAKRVTPAGAFAGQVLMFTCGSLGVAILGAATAQGKRQQICLGMALFGCGYLALPLPRAVDRGEAIAFPTEHLLSKFRRVEPAVLVGGAHSLPTIESANLRIATALGQSIDMRFPDETPLEDVLKHIQAATVGPDGWEIPIFVDPLGLQEAEKTMTSPVTLDLEGVPLETSLDLLLKQIELTYRIQGGLLRITSQGDETFVTEDPFLVVGHCILALIAAGVGGMLAPIVRSRIQRANSASN